MKSSYDAIVVGAGPNGLAAAITLAQKDLSVLLVEASDVIGGGLRSAELTEPGFVHDLCSAIHPLGAGSPFFRTLPLSDHGLEWVHPEYPVAHPLDGGRAAVLHRGIRETGLGLGPDGEAWHRLFAPLVEDWSRLENEILGPIMHWPRSPLTLAVFGLKALRSGKGLAEAAFQTEEARALFGGIAAHAIMPLDNTASAAFGLTLGALGHVVGWPMPKGGSQFLADALASYFRLLGGEICTGVRVDDIRDLPDARAMLLDVTPKQVLAMAGHALPSRYRRKLEAWRYGMGVFKLDYALSEPIPWTSEACRRAGTIHVGGTLEEMTTAERTTWEGGHPEQPYVLLAQQSLFDDTRAPAGNHVLWAYCHVPHGSTKDMSVAIESHIERFAPGFRDCIEHRHHAGPAELEARNANLIGGDINGGVQDLGQILKRPVFGPSPYRTPATGLYICSSSTPPGGGVHGMCGYHAATLAIKDVWGG